MDDERIRMAIEDSVARAVEAGWSASKIHDEVDYAIESHEDDAG